jgi:hypothetical protein
LLCKSFDCIKLICNEMKDSGHNFNVSSSIHSLAKNENFETRS